MEFEPVAVLSQIGLAVISMRNTVIDSVILTFEFSIPKP